MIDELDSGGNIENVCHIRKLKNTWSIIDVSTVTRLSEDLQLLSLGQCNVCGCCN